MRAAAPCRAPGRGGSVEKLVDASLLRPGVFVVRLDRPWQATPFSTQGFLLLSDEEVTQVRQHCHKVFIDPTRGEDVALASEDFAPARPEPPPAPSGLTTRPAPITGVAKHAPWPYQTTLEEEIGPAFDLHRNTRSVIEDILRDVRLGKSIDCPAAKEMVAELAESIIRNPDALTFLTQLRIKDEYLTFHSLNVCIFSLVFGRHIGLSKDDLRALGLGALLHDVGYIKLPADLFKKPGTLTREEFDLIRTHVAEGVAVVKSTPDIPPGALEVVQDHHERADGSGYPRCLKGKAIGLFGMAVGILDNYDAITTDRPWRSGFTAYDALRNIYQRREKEFDENLVLQFIQCIGIYPVGSLVELSTGDIAVIVASHPRYRLLPKVRLLLDRDGQRYGTPITVDLLHQQASANVQPIKIKMAVHASRHGVTALDLAAATLQA